MVHIKKSCLAVQSLRLCPTLRFHVLQHTRLPCPSLSPGVCSSSCPLSQWCNPTISSSATLFSFCLQSFPASGSFPMSQLCIRWPEYWSFNFSISPFNEYSVLNLNKQNIYMAPKSSKIEAVHKFNGKGSMIAHSSILAWRIPWTEEPGRLQSMELHRAGHD